MIKKLFLAFRFLVISCAWTIVWFGLTQQAVLRIWNFNFLSRAQWKYIASFWQANGTIKGASDYLLFLTVLFVFLLWIWWGRKLLKVRYFKLFLKPFESFSKRQIDKYANEGKNVVVKNLVMGEKITLDDLINEKIKEEEKAQETTKESEKLRADITKKISESKK